MKEVIVRLTADHIKVKGGEYVQDLVRCKDCKWQEYGMCHNSDGLADSDFGVVGGDDFCSRGERKSDE